MGPGHIGERGTPPDTLVKRCNNPGMELYRARAVEAEDDRLLAQLDREYADTYRLEPVAGRAGTSFHARSGHSFVAEREGEVHGFVLASAQWSGGRPAVRVERLAGTGPEALDALVAALVKSAYDAGVYDLEAALPAADEAGIAALERGMFAARQVAVYGRVLGSRGKAAA